MKENRRGPDAGEMVAIFLFALLFFPAAGVWLLNSMGWITILPREFVKLMMPFALVVGVLWVIVTWINQLRR